MRHETKMIYVYEVTVYRKRPARCCQYLLAVLADSDDVSRRTLFNVVRSKGFWIKEVELVSKDRPR